MRGGKFSGMLLSGAKFRAGETLLKLSRRSRGELELKSYINVCEKIDIFHFSLLI